MTVKTLTDIAIALAAVFGSFTAWKGLTIWREQNVWQEDNNLARRLLIALYQYRDSIYSVRHPAMAVSEMELDVGDPPDLPEDKKRSRGVILAYSRRWERHLPQRNELDALLIEADAVWGKKLSEMAEPLKLLEHELYAYIWLYLDAHFRGAPELRAQFQKILASKRDILYDTMDEEDEYRIDFNKKLAPLEDYLRTKMGRQR
ncbi:hypothetical protein [Acidimangrovimonas pyrenivorans]|uniref:DUF4760 domain-containing protein n=1 Tax=Acidimangrovimonas pyrenivorans TaxID=2030798 RepID=A0ABV7AM39_9RHOB